MAKGRHWSGVHEAGTVIGMKFLLWIYNLLGVRGFRVILHPVMFYYFCIRKDARYSSREYLRKISPYLDRQSFNGLSSFKHFMMFGEVLLDKLLAWMGEYGKDNVVFETPGVIETTTGGIIIVSHLGNSEICGALMEYLPDLKVTALVHDKHAEKFNSIVEKVENNKNLSFMQVTEITPVTAMLLSEKVEDGEYIVIAGDRTPLVGPKRVSVVDFFGAPAEFPQGAFILASLLKCPVFLMFCLKSDKRYHVFIENFSSAIKLPRKDKVVAIDSIVQDYAARLQFYCLKAPLQWFNFFNFWKVND